MSNVRISIGRRDTLGTGPAPRCRWAQARILIATEMDSTRPPTAGSNRKWFSCKCRHTKTRNSVSRFLVGHLRLWHCSREKSGAWCRKATSLPLAISIRLHGADYLICISAVVLWWSCKSGWQYNKSSSNHQRKFRKPFGRSSDAPTSISIEQLHFDGEGSEHWWTTSA